MESDVAANMAANSTNDMTASVVYGMAANMVDDKLPKLLLFQNNRNREFKGENFYFVIVTLLFHNKLILT